MINSIDVYSPEEAVKRYGEKAKNGAIAITTTELSIVEDKSPAELRKDFSKSVSNDTISNTSKTDISKKVIVQGGTWKDVEEYIKIGERQLPYNGRTVLVKDLGELLKKDTKGKVILMYTSQGTRDKNDEIVCKVSIEGKAIKPENPEYYYVINGKWVYSIGMIIPFVHSIDVYPPEEAVKRYGSKAKNGAIAITTTELSIVEDKSPPPPPPSQRRISKIE